MRKNATLLHLMTIFLAVIGLCAATLSGYILFYSQFPHPSTSKIDIAASPEITTAQVNNAEDDADPVHFESDQEDYDILPEKEEIDTLETSSVSSFSSGFEPTAQEYRQQTGRSATLAESFRYDSHCEASSGLHSLGKSEPAHIHC